MTTFTTEDKERAYNPGLTCVVPSSATGMEVDLVAEAPYHPGYEDAVISSNSAEPPDLLEYRIYKERHINTAKKIIEFIKNK